jgi:thermostable 8-oxoguanine DNA glycosylase
MLKIDPNNITDYHRTETQLQRFWLFCLFAAGKNSDWAATKVEQLLGSCLGLTPFRFLEYMVLQTNLHTRLYAIKSGQYTRLHRAIVGSLFVDLAHCGLDDLLTIYGVGPKTARLFLVHTRKDAQHAVLDTHILRWMSEQGIPTPKTTPSPVKYAVLEKECIKLFQKHYPQMSFAEADLHVWKQQRYRR